MILPDEDGVTHINIYSKGKTELGRLLTNMSEVGFDHPVAGYFRSMEGFWYYYFTRSQHNEFKVMNPWECKKAGKLMRDDRIDKEGISSLDKVIILQAIGYKIKQSMKIIGLMIDSELPFAHYYCYGDRVIMLPQYDWMTEEFERIRKILKEVLLNQSING